MSAEQIAELDRKLAAAREKLRTLPEGEERDRVVEVVRRAMEVRRGLANAPAAAEKPTEAPEERGSVLNVIGESGLLGLGNEIAATGAAAVGTMLPERMGGFPSTEQPEGFVRAQQEIAGDLESREQEYREREPASAFIAETAASMIPINRAVSAATRAIPGQTPAGRVTKNVVGTTAGEAAYAAAQAPEGERAESAQAAAAFGPLGALGGEAFDLLAKRYRRRADIKAATAADSPDTMTVGWKKDDAGRVIKDTAAREARRQGAGDKPLLAIRMASPKDRQIMRRMLEAQKAQDTNYRAGVTARAGNEAGQVVVDRLDSLRSMRREFGEQIDEIADTQLRGEPINLAMPRRSFADQLRQMGVEVDADGALNFDESELADLPELQRQLKRAWGAVSEDGGPRDALAAHRLKRRLDQNIDYGKREEGLSGRAENALQTLREGINERLQGLSPEYARANEAYSEMTGAINELTGISPSLKMEGPAGAMNAAALLRRVDTNLATVPRIVQALEELDRVALKYGLPVEEDTVALAYFAGDLERMFGESARGSMRGIVQRAASAFAPGGDQGMGSFIADVGRAAYEPLAGINRDQAFEALDNLLRSYD